MTKPMDSDKKIYVISVYSENQIGLLGSFSNIFARRGINIESLTVFPSEFPGVHHFTFRVAADEQTAGKLVKFIEKKVDVLKAFYFLCDDVWSSEHEIVSKLLSERMYDNNKQ